MERTAIIDPTEAYRYHLSRVWDHSKPRAAWVMCNPSTADASRNDDTILRCVAFCRSWGFGGFDVVNLFALRTPHPSALKRQAKAGQDPVGPENDAHLLRVVRSADLVIAAWGTNGAFRGRDQAVRRMLAEVGASAHYLELTDGGHPKHPLARGRHRISDDATPKPLT